jgi:Phosphoglucomutase/phosphomannomutase, alpha/beta/alpha domain I
VPDFDRLVKAYDIRGTVPDEMNAGVARDVGALFVRLTGTRRLAVARDMRDSSRPWPPPWPRARQQRAPTCSTRDLGPPTTPTTSPAPSTSRPP